ncbi:DNA-methyltransferase [Raineya orbicola]|uniref:Methyltransferase n=1 Tax=Raineya orbicola TaxID=2016530 RepID=A0A2N3IIM3_9BACT|nr:site-specific DNA-methyltransferase [Raineya orbicola]PKQ70200.1 DNA modification methylase [Raineya orbicola]
MKFKSDRNKTLTLNNEEASYLEKKLIQVEKPVDYQEIMNKTIWGNSLEILRFLPSAFVDLAIIDPPYNLDKDFGELKFSKMTDEEYETYLESWFPDIIRLLKPNASLYICGDWKNSHSLYNVLKKYLKVRNRITWQREKGRGALKNWKNCTEDIWFATVSEDYYFDVESVKMKRKVIAPYKENGKPKDWQETEDGNFRLTYPSNFWDDITIPYWSMPENTEHPTQKPEKLIAKLILASSPPNAIIFDPFLGSGTTSVVAKKLGRNYCGVEINKQYCLWAEKRLMMAEADKRIQGYADGVFWERNTLNFQQTASKKRN